MHFRFRQHGLFDLRGFPIEINLSVDSRFTKGNAPPSGYGNLPFVIQ